VQDVSARCLVDDYVLTLCPRQTPDSSMVLRTPTLQDRAIIRNEVIDMSPYLLRSVSAKASLHCHDVENLMQTHKEKKMVGDPCHDVNYSKQLAAGYKT
jgi:hypothetical protein